MWNMDLIGTVAKSLLTWTHQGSFLCTDSSVNRFNNDDDDDDDDDDERVSDSDPSFSRTIHKSQVFKGNETVG